MNNLNRVAIYVRTRDRSDFVIRQLNYYASVNCPHPIYIGDASNTEHSGKIKETIKKLGGKLDIIYKLYDESGVFTLKDAHADLLSLIREKYCASVGDDDYFIPDSLTKCAEFLEEHSDYASASGYAVSIRVKNNGVYGELNYISDYPRKQVELDKATERVIRFFEDYYTPTFYVHKIENMRRYWDLSKKIPNMSLSTEVIPSALLLAEGKSKVIDCLSLVRQIHDRHFALTSTYDWLTSGDWHESREIAEDVLAKEMAAQDKIDIEKAKGVFRKGMWIYLKKYLAKDFDSEFPPPTKVQNFTRRYLRKTRSFVGKVLPVAKKLYRTKIKPFRTGRKYLHCEITDPRSKYYRDFKPVIDSFTGQIKYD